MDKEKNFVRILKATTTDQVLLTAGEAAEMFKCTSRTWRQWDAQGKIPQPIRIGRNIYWRNDELLEWIEADCPPRQLWQKIRKAAKNIKN